MSESASTQADFEALKALQADAPELERIENLLDRFNVFETIGFVGQEVMRSRFLAFLALAYQSGEASKCLTYSPFRCWFSLRRNSLRTLTLDHS